MRCPRCNAQLTDNASFCGICGNALSVPQNNGPEVRPSLSVPGNNEATIVAAPWSDMQAAQPGPSSGGQPGAYQAPQAGSWSQGPRPPQTGWTPEQVVAQPWSGRAPDLQPARMNRSAVELPPPTRKKRRAGRIWARLFLVLVLLVAVLVGAWFLGVRPYLHNLAQTELDQALNAPESQMLLAMLVLPPGKEIIRGSENSMNLYLSGHNTDIVQNLHMTITPAGLSLSFSVYGQNCTIQALPIVNNGQLQVTNVQVQGVLGLIMSNDELTSSLNNNLQNFSAEMTHKITKLTLLEHEIDVQFG